LLIYVAAVTTILWYAVEGISLHDLGIRQCRMVLGCQRSLHMDVTMATRVGIGISYF
jgi:hypothetical protein